jgi:nucleotide-binding universal stress UspA family protein
MAVTAVRPPAPRASATSVFDRVVCAVDRSDESLAPARLGVRVAAPAGELTIVVHAGWLLPFGDAKLRAQAHATLSRAWAVAETFGRARATMLAGRPADVVLEEMQRCDATLAVVDIRQHHRPLGIAEGSLATVLLHEAPCSVLVAGPETRTDAWPRSIVVGLDGSVESAAAAAAAWELGARYGAPVRAVAATRGGHADLELVRRIAPGFEPCDEHPVPALVRASENADLVVVGNRGLEGLRALGSVSERLAHHAHCPVLVVRRAPTERGARR